MAFLIGRAERKFLGYPLLVAKARAGELHFFLLPALTARKNYIKHSRASPRATASERSRSYLPPGSTAGSFSISSYSRLPRRPRGLGDIESSSRAPSAPSPLTCPAP